MNNEHVQVARHTKHTDCWFVIDGKVYDVTKFLDEHPGGEEILVDSSGRDATREFEDVGHSDDARRQLDELYIGDLRPPTEKEIAEAQQQQSVNHLPEKPQSSFAIAAKWLFPLLLAGLAYLIRKYVK